MLNFFHEILLLPSRPAHFFKAWINTNRLEHALSNMLGKPSLSPVCTMAMTLREVAVILCMGSRFEIIFAKSKTSFLSTKFHQSALR